MPDPMENEMPDPQYFCMIHEGRCGSTVLASLINQHPQVVHFNEILTKGSWISPDFVGTELERKRDSHEIKLLDLTDYVSSLAGMRKATDKLARRFIGFEIKLNQLSSLGPEVEVPSLVREISAGLDGVRFMFLTRRNILRRHVSTLRCLFKEVSHAKNISDVNFDKVRVDGTTMRDWSYDFTRVHASLPEFLEISEARRLAVREFALAHGYIYQEYEDFERHPLAGAERIFDHLGLPHIEAASPLLKTGDLPLSDLIENYDEVHGTLENTRWSSMLDQ
jgi:hypothetical protein